MRILWRIPLSWVLVLVVWGLHSLAIHDPGFWSSVTASWGAVTIPNVGPVPVAALIAHPLQTLEGQFQSALAMPSLSTMTLPMP